MTTLNPDVTGDVGMTQCVQTVNYDMAIFDKTSGRVLEGLPKANNVIWHEFGGQEGAQTNTPVNKWGTISAMTIDPADDCTFWYTGTYLKTTGSYNWSTAIIKFKFSNCS